MCTSGPRIQRHTQRRERDKMRECECCEKASAILWIVKCNGVTLKACAECACRLAVYLHAEIDSVYTGKNGEKDI